MLNEPIVGTVLTLGRTKNYAIRIAYMQLTKEYAERGVVGYQILNTSTGVVELEGSQLHQAIRATAYLEANLADAKNPEKAEATPGPSDIFN